MFTVHVYVLELDLRLNCCYNVIHALSKHSVLEL